MKCLQGAANGNLVAEVAATAAAVGIAAAAAAAVGIGAAVAQVDDHTLHQLGHAVTHAAIHSIPHAVHLLTTHKPVEEPMDRRDSGGPVHPGTPGCNNGFVMIGKASSFK